jgi:phage gpG-like protein
MADNLNWQGDRAVAQIKAELHRRVQMASVVVYNQARELVSKEGAAIPSKRRGKLKYGKMPSRPGEPPHVQTGNLRRMIAFEVRGLIGRVGTNVPYARILELGGRTMAARPWLRRALFERANAVKALLSAPMRLK